MFGVAWKHRDEVSRASPIVQRVNDLPEPLGGLVVNLHCLQHLALEAWARLEHGLSRGKEAARRQRRETL